MSAPRIIPDATGFMVTHSTELMGVVAHLSTREAAEEYVRSVEAATRCARPSRVPGAASVDRPIA